jgi:predicted transcriptional regulator
MVARQLTEPRTANWIASEADWFYEPTKRVLERLVDNGVIRRTDEGQHTTYRPDYRQQAMHETMALYDDADSV